MSPLLQVRNLEVAFFTKDGVVRAVNGISYSLEEGDTLGIVGESGCGKSVSCMAMLRLIPEPPGRIMGGQVLFDGIDLVRMKRDDLHTIRGGKIAVIFQDPMASLNPVMNIGEQVAEAITVNLGYSHRQALHRTVELLTRVGIPQAEDRVKDYPHQFSGGMRQRVMIAMAISCQPKLLIADEPTTSLDVTVQAQIVDLVQSLQRELGMAVIWITHDLGVIARLARHVNVMYAGFIIETGPAKDIFKHPHHPYTIGLLGSVPKPDVLGTQTLVYIDGAPPDMLQLAEGCSFYPRCPYHTEQCLKERPDLVSVGDNHGAACWNVAAVQARLAAGPATAGAASGRA
ncbi:MAG: peptide ABC transporter ATP-binding protein [Chloroflexi bacterium HGW-Chloroflexi-1]|nr:MAG: peptide ABC transporter ATP-binding protein [Chloroflexi bacterium HGW-Chloroflexi-1]